MECVPEYFTYKDSRLVNFPVVLDALMRWDIKIPAYSGLLEFFFFFAFKTIRKRKPAIRGNAPYTLLKF